MADASADRVVGINIRDNILRMTEAASVGGECRITKVSQGRVCMPLQFSVFNEKHLIRRYAEDLDRLHETADFHAQSAVFTLDSTMVFIKKIPVDPNLSGPRLREHVQWEVGQFLISPSDEYVIDFEHQPPANGEAFANVVIVVVRKTITDFLKEIFLETNLRLQAIDVDVFAAQRVLARNYELAHDSRVAMVDVRKENLQFSILKGENFFLAQEIDYVLEEGELLRREDDYMARVIAKELRRIILDNKLGRGVEDISSLLIYGEGLSSTVIEALRTTYNIRIELANPFRRLKLTGQIGDPTIQAHPETFVVSVGAAIKGF